MEKESPKKRADLRYFLKEPNKNKYWYMLIVYFFLVSPLIQGTLKTINAVHSGQRAVKKLLNRSDSDQNDPS